MLDYTAFDPFNINRFAAKMVVLSALNGRVARARTLPCNTTETWSDSFNWVGVNLINVMINYFTQTTKYSITYGKTCDDDGCCLAVWGIADIRYEAYDRTNFDIGKSFFAFPLIINDEDVDRCFNQLNMNDFDIYATDSDVIRRTLSCE